MYTSLYGLISAISWYIISLKMQFYQKFHQISISNFPMFATNHLIYSEHHIFERELAFLVVLQGESIWKGDGGIQLEESP